MLTRSCPPRRIFLVVRWLPWLCSTRRTMRKYSASWRIIKSELSGRFLFGAKHFDISGQTGIQAPGPDSSKETEKSKEVLREGFKLNNTNNTLSVLGLGHLIRKLNVIWTFGFRHLDTNNISPECWSLQTDKKNISPDFCEGVLNEPTPSLYLCQDETNILKVIFKIIYFLRILLLLEQKQGLFLTEN